MNFIHIIQLLILGATPEPTLININVEDTAHHLVSVEMIFPQRNQPLRHLSMANWIPGSYKIRDFAQHLQGFEALTAGNQPLVWRKTNKSTWSIEVPDNTSFKVRYQILANEFTVRTNHLDELGGHLNPGAFCLYEPAQMDRPFEIELNLPPQWAVETALPIVGYQRFRADDYHHLVDAPLLIGPLREYQFTVRGIPHKWVILGPLNMDEAEMVTSLQRGCRHIYDMFGAAPFQSYRFLTRFRPERARGGLEHLDSTLILARSNMFHNKKGWDRFLLIMLHEYFHAWNVKAVQDVALQNIDYQSETYSDLLWFHEGWTSYYAKRTMIQAGLWKEQESLKALAKDIHRYLTRPGNGVENLSAASFDAWIHQYAPSEARINAQQSYYSGGALQALSLDLTIRQVTENKIGLDDLMRHLYSEFGARGRGITRQSIVKWIRDKVGSNTADFLVRSVDQSTPLPLDRVLEYAGLSWRYEHDDKKQNTPLPPDPILLGAELNIRGSAVILENVIKDGPTWNAGCATGDELIALDDKRMTTANKDQLFKWYRPGDRVAFLIDRDGRIMTKWVDLAADPGTLVLHQDDESTPNQVTIYRSLFNIQDQKQQQND